MTKFGDHTRVEELTDQNVASEFEEELRALLTKYSQDDRIVNLVVMLTVNRANTVVDPEAMEESPYITMIKLNRKCPINWEPFFQVLQNYYMKKDPIFSPRLVMNMLRAFLSQYEQILERAGQLTKSGDDPTQLQIKARRQFDSTVSKLTSLVDIIIRDESQFSHFCDLFIQFITEGRKADPDITKIITQTEMHALLSPIYNLDENTPEFIEAREVLFQKFKEMHPAYSDRFADFCYCISNRFPYGLASCEVELDFLFETFVSYMNRNESKPVPTTTISTPSNRTVRMTESDMDKILSNFGSESQIH